MMGMVFKELKKNLIVNDIKTIICNNYLITFMNIQLSVLVFKRLFSARIIIVIIEHRNMQFFKENLQNSLNENLIFYNVIQILQVSLRSTNIITTLVIDDIVKAMDDIISVMDGQPRSILGQQRASERCQCNIYQLGNQLTDHLVILSKQSSRVYCKIFARSYFRDLLIFNCFACF